MGYFGRQIAEPDHQRQISLFGISLLSLHTMAETFILLLFASADVSNAENFNNFTVCLLLKFILFASMQVRYLFVCY